MLTNARETASAAVSAVAATYKPAPRQPAESRLGRLWRGPAEDPRWARPARARPVASTLLLARG